MSDFTPTTADVRVSYIQSFRKPRDWSETQPLLAEFNRWLEQVKAKAWEEGLRAGTDLGLSIAETVKGLKEPPFPAVPGNPYR